MIERIWDLLPMYEFLLHWKCLAISVVLYKRNQTRESRFHIDDASRMDHVKKEPLPNPVVKFDVGN
jgi:hypothetical protein